jgi:hypothetical protein
VYLHMYARMCACMRALVACIPACVCARACESCECAREQRERRERRRNPSARPPNVCHYVHMYVGTSTCERMYMHVCVRVDPMQACAYVRACLRARLERRRNLGLRPLVVSHYMYMYMRVCLSPYVYAREHV